MTGGEAHLRLAQARQQRVATALNFIVDHCGLPQLDDFCWIAVQETNVYAGLSAVMALQHARPEYFARVISSTTPRPAPTVM